MPICSKKKRIGLVSDNQGLLQPAETAAMCTAFVTMPAHPNLFARAKLISKTDCVN